MSARVREWLECVRANAWMLGKMFDKDARLRGRRLAAEREPLVCDACGGSGLRPTNFDAEPCRACRGDGLVKQKGDRDAHS